MNSRHKRPSNRSGGQKRHRRHHGGSRHGGKPHHGQGQSEEKFTKRFTQLIEQHQLNRRKYFDNFKHRDINRVNKLKRAFENSMKEIRDWQNSLPEKLKARFSESIDRDLTYSSNREIAPQGEEVTTDTNFGDPHFLKSQDASNFTEDEEESIGTMDDYRSYKEI